MIVQKLREILTPKGRTRLIDAWPDFTPTSRTAKGAAAGVRERRRREDIPFLRRAA